jgi:hypothetical protein
VRPAGIRIGSGIYICWPPSTIDPTRTSTPCPHVLLQDHVEVDRAYVHELKHLLTKRQYGTQRRILRVRILYRYKVSRDSTYVSRRPCMAAAAHACRLRRDARAKTRSISTTSRAPIIHRSGDDGGGGPSTIGPELHVQMSVAPRAKERSRRAWPTRSFFITAYYPCVCDQ